MILVLDAQKLIQTQTAECIVLGELLSDRLLVALNKTDLLKDEKEVQAQIQKTQKIFERTKFVEGKLAVVPVSAMVSGGATSDGENKGSGDGGIQDLLKEILQGLEVPDRKLQEKQKFMYSIDHCFQVKGQGTVITGTVLQGKVKVGDTIEFPQLGLQQKVKSIQMFRKPVNQAHGGDRIGMRIDQLDAEKLERGIATSPGFVQQVDKILVKVQKIGYFTSDIKTKSKFHLTIGHQTVMAQIRIFSQLEPSGIQGKLQRLSLGEGNVFRFNFEEEKKEELDRSVVYMHEDLLLSQK